MEDQELKRKILARSDLLIEMGEHLMFNLPPLARQLAPAAVRSSEAMLEELKTLRVMIEGLNCGEQK